MKQAYFLIQFLIILNFGLASCNSDNSSETSAPSGKLSVEIQNSDETIQKIQKELLLTYENSIVAKN